MKQLKEGHSVCYSVLAKRVSSHSLYLLPWSQLLCKFDTLRGLHPAYVHSPLVFKEMLLLRMLLSSRVPLFMFQTKEFTK